MTDTSAEHELVLTRLLNAPREKVWRCWTEEEHVVKWFAPKPWAIKDAVVEPHAGGRFAVCRIEYVRRQAC